MPRAARLAFTLVQNGADWKTGEPLFTSGQRSLFPLSPLLRVTPGILMSFYIPRDAASN